MKETLLNHSPTPRRTLIGLLIAGMLPLAASAQDAPPPRKRARPRPTPCCMRWK